MERVHSCESKPSTTKIFKQVRGCHGNRFPFMEVAHFSNTLEIRFTLLCPLSTTAITQELVFIGLYSTAKNSQIHQAADRNSARPEGPAATTSSLDLNSCSPSHLTLEQLPAQCPAMFASCNLIKKTLINTVGVVVFFHKVYI